MPTDEIETESTSPKRRRNLPTATGDLTPLQIAVIAALVIGVLIVALWLKRPAGGGAGKAPVSANVPILHLPEREQAPDIEPDYEIEYPEL